MAYLGRYFELSLMKLPHPRIYLRFWRRGHVVIQIACCRCRVTKIMYALSGAPGVQGSGRCHWPSTSM
eukprot:5995739-Pyramimonas_sp.AAC.1